MSETTTQKILCRDEYGEKIESMSVGDSFEIPLDDRQKILQFVLRKYKTERNYKTFTIDGILKIYRLK